MGKRKILPNAFLAITLCITFLWLPIFVSYYGLTEADFLSTGLSYENTDLNSIPGDQKSQFLLWGSMTGFKFWRGYPIEGLYVFTFLLPLIDQKNSQLRC
ncbi:MAG: hypothetical protein C0407_09060 [Desulfobacca sp.]|nr:hypothetical protein [Desulfobacca sp.]